MPWKSSSVMEERIKFVILANRLGVNISSLCRDFGISRMTGYLWLRRYQETGSLTSVRELSRRPHYIPNRTSVEHEQQVIGLRNHYGWGAKKLRELLLREGQDMKVVTINRILKRNNLIHPKDSHRPALKRFERKHPNELWQMDFKGDYRLPSGRCYPLSILDDNSRFAIGLYALKRQDTETVYNCLIEAFKSYGVPDAMLMDHGIPWWGNSNHHGLTRLSVRLINQGVKLHFSGIGHPQTQGKVERFHRTLEHAVRHHGKPSTITGWKELLDFFLEEYNYVRPHEALDMATPIEGYQPGRKAYNPNPKPWEYPSGSIVKELNQQGCFDFKKNRYFVCEALAEQEVRIEQIDKKLIVSYRHMYIREIDTETGKTKTLLSPVSKTNV